MVITFLVVISALDYIVDLSVIAAAAAAASDVFMLCALSDRVLLC